MATQAQPAPTNGKGTSLTLKGVNDKAKLSPTIDAASDKVEWILGRDDPKSKPDIDLGKDSGCSRNQGTVSYKYNKFTFKQIPTNAVAGYVLTGGKKFQILEDFVLDFGGKQKTLISFNEVLPGKQVKDRPEIVQSPLFIAEGKTEGLQKNNKDQVNISVSRLSKKTEEVVNFDAQKALNTSDKDHAQVWDYGQNESKSTFNVDFKGKFRIGYEPVRAGDDKQAKAFWYLEVLQEDPDCPIVLYFFKKEELKNSKSSEDFFLENGLRVIFGQAQYDIQIN